MGSFHTLDRAAKEISAPGGEEPGCLSSSFHMTGLSRKSTLERPSLSFLTKGTPLPPAHHRHILLPDSFHSTYHFLKLPWLLIYILTHFLSPQLEIKLRKDRTLAVLVFTESLLSKTVCDTQKMLLSEGHTTSKSCRAWETPESQSMKGAALTLSIPDCFIDPVNNYWAPTKYCPQTLNQKWLLLTK